MVSPDLRGTTGAGVRLLRTWICIENQAQAEELLRGFCWEDGFVRELRLVSPSYVTTETRSAVAWGACPTAKALLTSQGAGTPAVELLFVDIENFGVWFGGDLDPAVSIEEGCVEWRFHRHSPSVVRCSCLRYAWLDPACLGHTLRYGSEHFYDIGGSLVV